eukprot:jgi/Mesen1/5311/ME000264S04333
MTAIVDRASSGNVAAEDRQVQVRFDTRLPNHLKVPSTPYAVPARLTRYGLSEVVNTILGLEKVQPFDFLVDGELVRSSLEKLLISKGLSAESILVVEYIPAVVPPEPKQSIVHDDWVSAVDGSLAWVILTGSYDSIGRVWDAAGTCRCTLSGHRDAITAIAVPLEADSKKGGQKTAGIVRAYTGHTASVQCVAASPSGQEMASGSWDTSIRLWRVEADPAAAEEQAKDDAKKKRRADSNGGAHSIASAAPQVEARATLEGHTQCVSSVAWPDSDSLYSASWDHSLRSWDASTGSKAVLSLSVGGDGSALLATGGADSILRIWDTRAAESTAPVQQLLSHRGWITSVKWAKGSAHHLLSASHDGSIKLWDTRTKIPLYSLDAHTDKVLCADWWSNNTVISGGADSKLAIQSPVDLR